MRLALSSVGPGGIIDQAGHGIDRALRASTIVDHPTGTESIASSYNISQIDAFTGDSQLQPMW